jgi:ArsR family transcriptional regulator, arsenate/arsenite/antimonite-responsive transcriptional repressor
MQSHQVIDAFAALAHEHRLGIYRLLVERGPEGLSAGVIAEKLALAPSSLTFHVQALQRAALISQRRASRQLFYAADFAAMNEVVSYLTKNCCGQAEGACATPCKPPAPTKGRNKSRRAA